MTGKQMQDALDVLHQYGRVGVRAKEGVIFVFVQKAKFSPDLLTEEERRRMHDAGWRWMRTSYANS